jgi:hypothetical protein
MERLRQSVPRRNRGKALLALPPRPATARLECRLILGLLLFTTAASARDWQAPAGKNSALPVGSTIYAALDKSIDAKRAKPGDAIVARVTFPVLAHGKVLIENGARILGHVTVASSRSKDSPNSQLGMVFDRATLKGGEELPLNLTVQAIGFEGPLPGEAVQPESNPFPPPSASAQASPRHTPAALPPHPQSSDAQEQEQQPTVETAHSALDAGSKGAVNLPGLTLTEGTDPKHGSLVSSGSKNVKLERGYALVLRVIIVQAQTQRAR